MRFFKEGKSKSPVIPAIFGVILVIVILLSVVNSQPKYKDYTPGEWKNGVYSTEFLNFQFALPEGWTAATEEELDQLMRQAMDQSREDDPQTAEGYEKGTVKNAYEMKASQDGGDGVVVVMSQKVRLNVDNYLEKIREQYEGKAILNDLPGWTVGGKNYKGLKIELDDKIQYIYALYDGGYFSTIQMTGPADADLEDLREQFTDYGLE